MLDAQFFTPTSESESPSAQGYTSSEPPEKHTLSYLLTTKTDALSLHIWEEVCYKLKNIKHVAYIYLFDK